MTHAAGFLSNALGEGPPAELLAAVAGNGLDPAQRLAIHRNATRIGLGEALAAHYPAVRRLVGEAFFAALAGRFLDAHPPASPVLAEWGGDLAGFIEGFPPAADLPYLADVARLEWAINQVLHEADASPLDPARLAELPPEALPGARLHLHPAHRLLASPWPVGRIVEVNRGDDSAEATIRLDEGPDHLLIVRPHLDVAVVALGPDGLALIDALAAGHPLAAALDRAAGDGDPGTLLGRLLASGVVIGVGLEENSP